ncbi:MAG: cytochrome c3 family protein [Desulfovermiculus sp.]|nr:cytochrome c3 family protein [Desulfovermiculus sp.]
MSRILFISLGCFALSICLLFPELQASSLQIPQEVVMDEAQGKTNNPLYAPVTMPHEKHIPQGCQVCHHTCEDTSQPPHQCTAAGCHDLIGANGSDMQKVESAFNAFHNRKSVHSCMGCHIQKNEADEVGGPFRNCAECHVKNQ